MKLLDVVVLIKDLPDLGLRKGQVGTVIEVYEPGEFEIEFGDLQGKSYTLEILNTNELMQIHYSPLPETA